MTKRHAGCFYVISCAAPRTPFDLPLLRKSVEWVLAEDALPEEQRAWIQDLWTCESGMCVAGYVALTDPAVRPDLNANGRTNRGHVSDIAERMLGIYTCESDLLFNGGNDATDILRVARAIATAHGEVLGL